MKPSINLIWQTNNGDETKFEEEYIKELLFSEFEQNIFFDNKSYQTIFNNSVIIYSNNSNEVSNDFLNYLNKFKDKNFNFYLLHLSNENLNHNFDYYHLANHVFRSYYDSNINAENCTFIPLGFKSGFLNKDKTYKKLFYKKYEFSFIGQPKSDRNQLIEILSRKENVFLHLTNQWNCPTAISQENCKDIYQKTMFVPCPMGWVHPDSFRIMESLESGAIPILKKYDNIDYFNKIWGETPIPIINSWEDIETISLDKNTYNKLYKEIFEWYGSFKEKLSQKIYNIITKNL
jgi:hypothetical protein